MWEIFLLTTGVLLSQTYGDQQGPTARAIDITPAYPQHGWRPMAGIADPYPLPRAAHHLISLSQIENTNKAQLAHIAHHNAQILRQYNQNSPITTYHNPFTGYKSNHLGQIMKGVMNNIHKNIQNGLPLVPKPNYANIVNHGTKNGHKSVSFQTGLHTHISVPKKTEPQLTPPPLPSTQRPQVQKPHPVMGKLQAHMALAGRRAKPTQQHQAAPSLREESFAPIPFIGIGLLGREKLPAYNDYPYLEAGSFKIPQQNEVLPSYAISDEFTRNLVPPVAPATYKHQDSSNFRDPKPTPARPTDFIPSPSDSIQSQHTEEQADILTKYNIGHLPLQDVSKFSYDNGPSLQASVKPPSKQQVFYTTTNSPIVVSVLPIFPEQGLGQLSQAHSSDSSYIHNNQPEPPKRLESNHYSTSHPMIYAPAHPGFNTDSVKSGVVIGEPGKSGIYSQPSQPPSVDPIHSNIYSFNQNGPYSQHHSGPNQEPNYFQNQQVSTTFFGSEAVKQSFFENEFSSTSTARPFTSTRTSDWFGEIGTFTTKKPFVFKNLERPSVSEYKQHKLMHPSYTGTIRPPNRDQIPTEIPFLPTPLEPEDDGVTKIQPFFHNIETTVMPTTKRRPTKTEDVYLNNLFTKLRNGEVVTTPVNHRHRRPELTTETASENEVTNEMQVAEYRTIPPRTIHRQKQRRKRPRLSTTTTTESSTRYVYDSNRESVTTQEATRSKQEGVKHRENVTPRPRPRFEYENGGTHHPNRQRYEHDVITTPKTRQRYENDNKGGVVSTVKTPNRHRQRLPSFNRVRTTPETVNVDLSSSAKPTALPTTAGITRTSERIREQNAPEWHLDEVQLSKNPPTTENFDDVYVNPKKEILTTQIYAEEVLEHDQIKEITKTKPETTSEFVTERVRMEPERRTVRPKVEATTETIEYNTEEVKPVEAATIRPILSNLEAKRNRLRFKEKMQHREVAEVTEEEEMNDITTFIPSTTTSTTTTTTEPSTTTLKSHRIRPKNKYEINERPRFSVKDYRQRLNQYTTTTTAPGSVASTTFNSRIRFSSRNRVSTESSNEDAPKRTRISTESNEENKSVRNRVTTEATTDKRFITRPRVDDELPTTTEAPRKRFTPKDPRHRGSYPSLRESSSPKYDTESKPTRRGSTRKDFNRVRSTTESSGKIDTSSVRISLRNNSLTLKRPYPSLRTRIQAKLKESAKADVVSESSEEPITLIETPLIPDSKFEITTASSKAETSIMKIAKDSSKVTDAPPADLHSSPSDYSQRVAELTQSQDYNKPGLFKSVQSSSRRVPGYFTIATDDPILPIEAFFPQFAQKNDKQYFF